MSARGRNTAMPPRLARALGPALALALAGLALAASAAEAAPTQVSLRVEGGTETVFEGPIASEGHVIQASSDTQSRPCNGINPNDPENTTPQATPTATAVDAMTLIDETFDGRWYESYDDYLITRWGPIRESEGRSWFLIVNHTLTDVGGCQVQLHEGAEVVWDYALASPGPKAMLELYPAGDAAAAPPLTADAKLGTPFAVEVQTVAVSSGKPPALPERKGFTPTASASVAPVGTTEKGFETIETASPEAVATTTEGKASISFTTAGWHRVKASHSGAVASNRLDVCVSATGEGECGPLPPEDLLRSVDHEETVTEHEPEHTPPGNQTQTGQEETHTTTQSGSGPSATPSTGAASPSAPSGALQVAGYSLAALDVRSPTLHFHGHWKKVKDAAAWHGLAAIGTAGATLSAHLAAGRAAFAVLYARHARVEVVAGTRRQKLALTTTNVQRLLKGPDRSRSGTVTLRVLSGTVAIDGVAVIT